MNGPSGLLRSHILTVEFADAEAMTILVSLLDNETLMAATEFTAPWWPCRTAETSHWGEKNTFKETQIEQLEVQKCLVNNVL